LRIADIADPVTVAIRLVGVGRIWAVVYGITDSVAVSIRVLTIVQAGVEIIQAELVAVASATGPAVGVRGIAGCATVSVSRVEREQKESECR